MSVLLKSANVLYDGKFEAKDIVIDGGIVSEILSPHSFVDGYDEVIDLKGKFIFPGLIDVHTHLREPGFFYKEGIATATAAAATMGYTALFAMPNLDPVPDSPENINKELALIKEKALIKVYPYAAVTVGEKGEKTVDIEGLKDLAVAFSDDGKGVQREEIMLEAMKRCKAVGKIIAAHCEDESLVCGGYIHKGAYAAAHGHRGIPSESEWKQIERDIALVRITGCGYHVCHVSAARSVELIREAKKEGLPVTAETAPHYLTLDEGDLREDGRFKMNPPLRGRADREALVQGVADGTIDLIATDHAPHSAEEKSRGLKDSLMGITGLETAFPVLYTELVKTGVIPLEKLIALMSTNAADIFGVPGGRIVKGGTADLCVYDLGYEYVIDSKKFVSKGKSTPFDGRKVCARCDMTFEAGRLVWKR